MTVTALIVAAGRGTRAGGDIPKQYQSLGDRPILERTCAAFGAHPRISSLVLVVHPDDRSGLLPTVELPEDTCVVDGASNRDGSVRAGLAAVPDRSEIVLIHDAARPLIPNAVIDRVINALAETPGAAPALPVTDALWRGKEGMVSGTQDRTGLWRAQTPQGFRLDAIRAAHAAWPDEAPAADDVAVARAYGLDVAIVQGDEDNLKVTHPEDFARAASILASRERA